MSRSDEQHVRRFIFREKIQKAPPNSRTHWVSHTSCGNVSVAPSMLNSFYDAISSDNGTANRQCITEWLTPRFKFFVEVYAKRNFQATARHEIGRIVHNEVLRFGVQPTSVLVLGWADFKVSKEPSMMLRYVFEDVIVDKLAAAYMATSIQHELFHNLEGRCSEAVHTMIDNGNSTMFADGQWSRAIPNDIYGVTSTGDKSPMMLGSYAQGVCPGTNSQKNHSDCPTCLGSKWVIEKTNPFVLMDVLDARGDPNGAASKISAFYAVQRSSLRSSEPLSTGWTAPLSAPALPLRICASSVGASTVQPPVMTTSFQSEKSAHLSSPTKILLSLADNWAIWDCVTAIVTNHNPRYAKLSVLSIMCVGTCNAKHYVVAVHGPHDTYCLNICDHHERCSPKEGGRIGFQIFASGVRMICFNRARAVDGKEACKHYKQREDLNPLSPEQRKILKFGCMPVRGGTGSTSQQAKTLISDIHTSLNSQGPSKCIRKRR